MPESDEAVARVAKAEARAWLVRLRSGHATTADIDAFRRWCASHPERARIVHALSDVWSTLSASLTEIAQEQPEFAHSWKGRATTSRAWRPGRRAFVGFAVAAGASWLALRPPLQLWPGLGDLAADFAADYHTGTGEQRRVALANQVVVSMNTQTRIDVLPARARQNGINLLAGEAEVVANIPGPSAGAQVAAGSNGAPRHFVVVAGQGRLLARTARFDVRRSGDTVCVTCVSGAVALEHPRLRLTLMAAQQLVYDDRAVRPVVQVDPTVVTAWRRGLLVFDGVPLAQVVREINRYRPGKVVLNNAALGANRVQGQFPIARLNDAIDALGRLYDVHVTRLPGDITLLG